MLILKKGTTLTKRIIKPLIIPFAKLIGITKCNNAIINLSTSYNQEESDFVANNLWGLHSTREIMPKDAFMKENEVTFENHKFKTMSCWELHLKKLYGNYMQLPPKNQQESHNYDAYIN